MSISKNFTTTPANKIKYNGKLKRSVNPDPSGEEQEMPGRWLDYGARFYDAQLGRWHSVDPLAEKHSDYTPYAYVYNNPVAFIDPFGLDSIFVLDQGTRPIDNGTVGQTYTADVYVVQNGIINGPYSGSSYPNSVSNSDNTTNSNTANEGELEYNNASGHSSGTQQGLNLVDENGNRNTPGTDPNGNAVTMTYVNVHEGTSDKGNYNSRGSQGCITINPSDATNFWGNFDWSGTSGKTGNSTGTLFIKRGTNADPTRTRLQQQQDWQQNPLPTIQPIRAVRVNTR
jgi:RHS repeat-associated protein